MFDKDSKKIWEKYLINEVTQDDLNKINYKRQLSSLPFDNIFEGKYRVILPVIADETFDLILDKMQSCQAFKFDHFDFKTGKVILEIPVDEKFRHLVKGKKLRPESLNAVIAKMEQAGCVTPQEAAEFSKWVVQFSGEGLKGMGEQNYVILSRSPVDIVRMSDISGIDSCHGMGGRYYYCAVEEARQDAGFVGYLVKPHQLERLTKEEIENNLEIFADKDRGEDGIQAFGRIRVRAISIRGRGTVGVTESVIYGISSMKNRGNPIQVPGVYSTVRRFLKQKQNLPDAEEFKKYFQNGDVKLLGGSYLDSGDEETLVGNFYDTKMDHEESEDEIPEDQADIMEEELRSIHRRSEIDQKPHVHAGFDVDADGENAYYYAHGGITIDLDGYDIDLSEFDDSYEHYQVNRYFRDSGAKDTNGIFFHELGKLIKSETVADTYEIYEIYFDYRGDKIVIGRSISGDESSISYDVDDYYTFTNELIRWSEDYDSFLKAVLMAFRKAGLYTPPKHEYDVEEEINVEHFKHVDYDNEDNLGEIYLDALELFKNTILNKNYEESKPRLDLLASNISHNFSRYISEYYKQVSPEVEKHPEFNFESYNSFTFPEQSFTIDLGKGYSVPCVIKSHGYFGINFEFKTRNLKFMQFIDEHYYDFLNIFKANVIAALPPVRMRDVINNNHHFYMVLSTYKKYIPYLYVR